MMATHEAAPRTHYLSVMLGQERETGLGGGWPCQGPRGLAGPAGARRWGLKRNSLWVLPPPTAMAMCHKYLVT